MLSHNRRCQFHFSMFFEFFEDEDEEFDKHLEEIETVPISDNVAIPIEKGPVGRHPQEQACYALDFSPEKKDKQQTKRAT